MYLIYIEQNFVTISRHVVKFKPGAELALLIAELIMAMFIDLKKIEKHIICHCLGFIIGFYVGFKHILDAYVIL